MNEPKQSIDILYVITKSNWGDASLRSLRTHGPQHRLRKLLPDTGNFRFPTPSPLRPITLIRIT